MYIEKSQTKYTGLRTQTLKNTTLSHSNKIFALTAFWNQATP
jgi:hypothetical protein